MRIWDVPPRRLCRNHLLGEHRELHAVWSILVRDTRGYARHPETLRWRGKLAALYLRHEALQEEMESRDFVHRSPLDRRLATGRTVQDAYVDSIRDQWRILRAKGCDCRIPGSRRRDPRMTGSAVGTNRAGPTRPPRPP